MGWGRPAIALCLAAALGFLVARSLPLASGDRAAPSIADQPPAGAVVSDQGAGAALPYDETAAPADGQPRTLADILRIDSDFGQTAALYDLVRQADVGKLERLIDETDTVPGMTDRRAALSILYARYADLAPESAVDYLLAYGGVFKRVELTAVFHAWSRSDLPAAIARAAELEPAWRQVAGQAILMSRDDLAPARQREVAERLGVDNVLPQVAVQQAMDLAARNPLEAWQSALSNADEDSRRRQLQGVANTWARQDPIAALNAVTVLEDPQLRARLQAMVVGEWSRQYPQDAVAWALAQPPSAARSNLIAQALSGVAEDDPRTALDMAQGLSGRERSDVLERVFSQWAQRDPAEAARSVAMLDQPLVRRSVIFTIASNYARQDPESALEWVATLDSGESGIASQTVFSQLARDDPERASRLLTRLPEGSSRGQAAQAVVQHWAQQDPQAAAQWVDTFTQAGQRRSLHTTLLQQWAQYDRDAAVSYLDRIPSRAEREAAIVGIISSQRLDPEFAESLYGELRNEAQRTRAARSLYQSFARSDAQRAERYRQAAGLNQ